MVPSPTRISCAGWGRVEADPPPGWKEVTVTVTALLMTGFPGFLGSALLPRLLARRPQSRAVCLVQGQYLDRAGADPRARGHRSPDDRQDRTRRRRHHHARTRPVPRGQRLLDASRRCGTSPPSTTSPSPMSWRAGSTSTGRRTSSSSAGRCPACRRLHYVSTCYVSGRYDGEFTEDASTRARPSATTTRRRSSTAELLVRKAMPGACRRRSTAPASSSGDSDTGETQKFDGPYFFASFLRRQRPRRARPAPSPTPTASGSTWSRGTSSSRRWTSSRCSTSRLGGPTRWPTREPPTAREIVDAFADRLGKRVVWVPMPLALTRRDRHRPRGGAAARAPRRALDYFASPTTYSTRTRNATSTARASHVPRFERLRGSAARLHGRASRGRLRERWSDTATKRRT